jgi:hypothetical protein
LLDDSLELKAYCRERYIIGLGAERVRFTPEFLSQEVEPPADRSVDGQELAGRADMGLEAVDLLADVGAGRKKRRLLVQPRRIERPCGPEKRRDMLGKPCADGFGLTGRTHFGGLDEARDLAQLSLDDALESSALPCSRRGEGRNKPSRRG